MKRTKDIDLGQMRKAKVGRFSLRPLALAVTAAALTACSSKEEVQIVASIDECTLKTELTYEQCKAAYEAAVIEAGRTGPKYRSVRNCEAEFGYGHCQSNSSGFFMPMMAGFMVGQMMGGRDHYYGGYGYNPVFRYSNPYSSHNNRIMTADGSIIGRSGQSSYRVGKSALKPKPAVSRTVSRGGFGSVASAKSSWGGGKSGGWGG